MTRDTSPVHMTKLQYTIHTACTYKTRDRSPVHVTKITMYTACTYNRSPVHMTKLQYTQHSPTRPEQGCQYTLVSCCFTTQILIRKGILAAPGAYEPPKEHETQSQDYPNYVMIFENSVYIIRGFW